MATPNRLDAVEMEVLRDVELAGAALPLAPRVRFGSQRIKAG